MGDKAITLIFSDGAYALLADIIGASLPASGEAKPTNLRELAEQYARASNITFDGKEGFLLFDLVFTIMLYTEDSECETVRITKGNGVERPFFFALSDRISRMPPPPPNLIQDYLNMLTDEEGNES